MTQEISFTVFGVPQSRGSKRAFPFQRKDGRLAVAVSDNNPKSKDWMAAIRESAIKAFRSEVIRDPVWLTLKFYFPRPKGHFGNGKNARKLKASAPVSPAVRPDLLKLARGVEDALIGLVYVDDSQIVSELLQKFYGEPARVEIVIQTCPNVQLERSTDGNRN